MTVITTKRLLLKEADLNDSAFFFRLLNSPGWLEFIGDKGIASLKDAEGYIRDSLIKSYKENGFGLYKMVLKQTGRPIGLCGLVKRSVLPHPDIGFALLPEYEGKAYALEAAQATLHYARSELGLSVILAITAENNTRSGRLLEKTDLRQSGRITIENDALLLYSSEKATSDPEK